MHPQALAVAVVFASLSAGGATIRPDARIFSGQNLDAVVMPIGGIGTGTVWLAGDGRLRAWQVFNNSDERPLPDTFMAVWAGGPAGGARVLQRGSGWNVQGFQDVSCVGEYPFLTCRFRGPGFPISIELTGFNPMIPLATKDSAIPCAIFRLTATNTGAQPLPASFLFSLQNPVGYAGEADLQGRFYGGYGGNRNVFSIVPEGGSMHLSGQRGKAPRMAAEVRLFLSGRADRAITTCSGVRIVSQPGPVDAIWLEGLTAAEGAPTWRALGAAARDGRPVVISGAELSFWHKLAALKPEGKAASDRDLSGAFHEVFEDFEDGTYGAWSIDGTAFGKEPHSGTSPNQQPVSGFSGKRLVNTFLPDDRPHGRLTSQPFKVSRQYIGFLVGGGGHAGRTCINLVVDGNVVRTAAGRNEETLAPAAWDAAELKGKTARIEIVDAESGGWGHINIDQIIFSDIPPQAILSLPSALEGLVPLAAIELGDPSTVQIGAQIPSPFEPVGEPWAVGEATALSTSGAGPYEVLVARNGIPLLVTGPFGRGRVLVALAKRLPASWGMAFIARSLGTTYEHGAGIDPASPLWGDMTLNAVGDEPTACARWTEAAELWRDFGHDGRLQGPMDSGESPSGETYDCALSVPFTLEGGRSRTVNFAVTWHYPNVERFGHRGNQYASWFEDAREAARYVRANFDRLVADTELYHDTVYETNLPYYVIDAITSQTVIARGITSFWAREHSATGKDYFAGFEGCYGCCPLNCTHVWNYAQAHARLFPEIGRNLRWYDLMHYLKDSGETQHRQHEPHGAFIDGHCAVIEGTYREHLTGRDRSFLEAVYPRVILAVEWLIRAIDRDEDGVNAGHQWNTYDVATGGAHTFIGSQYLSALAAAEQMAIAMSDRESARRWRGIREAGSKNQDDRLWNGEYWIQIPDQAPANDYATGCHSDQLMGQWWSHMLGTGYLYPKDRVRKALQSIYQYNFRTSFLGFPQRPRRFVADGDSGLLICSWPKGGRPDPFILYADEVWTGIEYEVAALMIYEGLFEEAFAIVKAARDRYDGRLRQGLNHGPGGNPFNEIECGTFYARAMSSWSLLLASQGFVCDGPRGVLGFKPRWKPEAHTSFFTASEGWGRFVQRRADRVQTDEISCRYGTIRLNELVFEAPAGWSQPEVALNGRPLNHGAYGVGDEVRIQLGAIVLGKGDTISVAIPW